MKLLSALKHLFVPHHGNDYKPHFFREISVAIILFGSTFLLGASLGSSFFIHKTVLGASIAANVLVDLTNETRLAYNESPLVRNELLDKAAELKGRDMVSEGYFAHESPKGVTPWHWFKEVGYTFLYAGENLAVNFTESQDVQNAWMTSPLHRENILNVKFREIGIATIEGIYKGNPTIFVVQEFGTPAVAVAKAETTPVVESVPEEQPTSLPAPAVVKEEPKATGDLAIASGEVKGENVDPTPEYRPIVNTTKLAVVKNTESVEAIPEAAPVNPEVKYSAWYERLIFWGPDYIDTLYKILIILIALALITMIVVEIRRQHYKHIMYGAVMLAVLSIFVFINQQF